MKRIFSYFLIVSLSACTSMQRLDMQSNDLQAQIASGKVVKIGDEVKVYTTDGKTYEFEITKTSESELSGAANSISIQNIEGLETRQISVGKTALLIGGIVIVGGAIWAKAWTDSVVSDIAASTAL